MPDPVALAQIDKTLKRLMQVLDTLEHDDLEVDTGDGKLVLAFANGQQLILSRQSATGQIWLAEPGGGWHFDWRGTEWRCDKRGVELIATLEQLVAQRLGVAVKLR
ncbi:MAG: iron donor protein CyaY [Planctomycetota bacterium]